MYNRDGNKSRDADPSPARQANRQASNPPPRPPRPDLDAARVERMDQQLRRAWDALADDQGIYQTISVPPLQHSLEKAQGVVDAAHRQQRLDAQDLKRIERHLDNAWDALADEQGLFQTDGGPPLQDALEGARREVTAQQQRHGVRAGAKVVRFADDVASDRDPRSPAFKAIGDGRDAKPPASTPTAAKLANDRTKSPMPPNPATTPKVLRAPVPPDPRMKPNALAKPQSVTVAQQPYGPRSHHAPIPAFGLGGANANEGTGKEGTGKEGTGKNEGTGKVKSLARALDSKLAFPNGPTPNAVANQPNPPTTRGNAPPTNTKARVRNGPDLSL